MGFASFYKRLYPLIVFHAHYDVIGDELDLGCLFVRLSAKNAFRVSAEGIFNGMMCLNHDHSLAFAELLRMQIVQSERSYFVTQSSSTHKNLKPITKQAAAVQTCRCCHVDFATYRQRKLQLLPPAGCVWLKRSLLFYQILSF